MQKFVTIHLDQGQARKQKLHKEPIDSPKRIVEHLQEYLDDGWRIEALQAFGGDLGGWFAAVLEKKLD